MPSERPSSTETSTHSCIRKGQLSRKHRRLLDTPESRLEEAARTRRTYNTMHAHPLEMLRYQSNRRYRPTSQLASAACQLQEGNTHNPGYHNGAGQFREDNPTNQFTGTPAFQTASLRIIAHISPAGCSGKMINGFHRLVGKPQL